MPEVNEMKQPWMLMILDGWGLAPAGPGNAVAAAKPLVAHADNLGLGAYLLDTLQSQILGRNDGVRLRFEHLTGVSHRTRLVGIGLAVYRYNYFAGHTLQASVYLPPHAVTQRQCDL